MEHLRHIKNTFKKVIFFVCSESVQRNISVHEKEVFTNNTLEKLLDLVLLGLELALKRSDLGGGGIYTHTPQKYIQIIN